MSLLIYLIKNEKSISSHFSHYRSRHNRSFVPSSSVKRLAHLIQSLHKKVQQTSINPLIIILSSFSLQITRSKNDQTQCR